MLKSVQVRQPWTQANLQEVLRKNGVSASGFDPNKNARARTLQQFVQELQNGDCYFRIGEAGLVRVVDHVVVRLHAGVKPTRLIVEQKQEIKEKGPFGFALPT